MWFYPVFGYMPYNANAVAKAKGDMQKALTVLNQHLAGKKFVVGDSITLADIVIGMCTFCAQR